MLKRKDIVTTDYALHCMLLWTRSQDFETDISTAFSVRVWKEVGERLWDVVSKGDNTAAELAITWRLLYETLREWRMEQGRRVREWNKS